MAYKLDIPAKQAFIEKLLAEGYDTAEVKARPADIIATRGGVTWYYEIISDWGKLSENECTLQENERGKAVGGITISNAAKLA